jgi:hypothetical protein
MTFYHWKTAVNGDWNTSTSWDQNAAPNSTTSDAVLALIGTYTVTIATSDPTFTVDSVTIDNPLATLDLAGSLDLAGAEQLLALEAGTLFLAGVLKGGTVDLAGGTAVLQNDVTLDGLTYDGRLTTPANGTVYVIDGLTVAQPGGIAPGTIDLLNSNTTINFLDSETINNAVILAGPPGGSSSIRFDNAANTLTFGTHLQLDQTYGYIEFYAPSAGQTLDNLGTMTLSNGVVIDYVNQFTNAGTITLLDGEDFQNQGFSFTNTGLISIGQNAVFNTGGGTFANSGSISIGHGGRLNLQGPFAPGALSNINNNGVLQISGSVALSQFSGVTGLGEVALTGTLNLGGALLDITPGSPLGNLVVTGDVVDGTIELNGGSLSFANGSTLDGITFLGDVPIGNDTVYIRDGLTASAIGGGPGTIDLATNGAVLSILDNETLNNLTVLGAVNGITSYIYGNQGAYTLTLGSNATLLQTGGTEQLYAPSAGEGFVNDGTMLLSGGVLQDYENDFVNAGSIALTAGEVFSVESPSYTLSNSGRISVGAGSVFNAGGTFSNTGSITIAHGGTLALSGTTTLSQLTLASIANAGLLDITGTLDLGGGTLDIAQGTTFSDVLIDGDLTDGTIALAGGTLVFANGSTLDGITALGSLVIDAYPVYIRDGLQVKKANGSAPGTLDLTINSAAISVLDDETWNNLVILGAVRNNSSYIYQNQGAYTVTLGANTVFEQTGGTEQFYGPSAGEGLINDGTMLLASGALQDYEYQFTNAGTMALSNGEFFQVESTGYSFANTGAITIGANSVLALQGNFSNTGGITIAAGGTLALGGTTTLPQLTGITNHGTIEVTGTLALNGGTLTVAQGGTFADLLIDGDVTDGTFALNGGTLNFIDGATLDGVTVLGNLVPNAGTYIRDGLTVKTAGGGTPGTIDLRTANTNLTFQDSETLDNVTILGAIPGIASYIYTNYTGSETLTLGANSTFLQTGGTEQFYGPSVNQVLDNLGTIVLSGGVFQDYQGLFINAGGLTLLSGENFAFESSGYTLDNTGTISIGANTVFTVSGTLNNTGSVYVASGGTLDLSGSLTLAELSGVSGPGELLVAGTLDLGGGTLDLASYTNNLLVSGEVVNGTIIEDAGTLAVSSTGTLGGVTLHGNLVDLGTQIQVVGGLTVDNLAGTGPGTIDLRTPYYVYPYSNYPYSVLYFEDSETLNNATVLIGGANSGPGYSEIGPYPYNSSPTTLTLATNLDLVQTSGTAMLYYVYSGDAVINAGTMSLAGGTFDDDAQTFTNTGTIALSNQAYFNTASNPILQNLGLITIGADTDLNLIGSNTYANSGTIAVAAGGTLQISSSNFTNTGTIALTGGGLLELTTGETLPTLGSVVGSGTLEVDANQVLDLGGGTLDLGAGKPFSTLILKGTLTDGTLKYESTGGAAITGVLGNNLTVSGASDIATTASTIGGLDSLAGGTLTVAPNSANSNVTLTGTLASGTLALDGGLFSFGSGSTLSAMTVLGVLDPATYLNIIGGLTVETAGGGTPGTIDLRTNGSYLNFVDSETLNNVVLLAGPQGGGTSYIYAYQASNETLTLGANVELLQNSGNVQLYAPNSGEKFTNLGAMLLGGGIFQDYVTTFANAGTINLVNNEIFQVESGGYTFVNTGVVNIAAGAELVLAGTTSLSSFTGINNAGLIDITGTLELGGGTLNVASGSPTANIEIAGDIAGGTIAEAGGTITFAAAATLDGITVLGTLNTGTGVYVYDGLHVKTAGGALPGTIDLRTQNDNLTFEDSETLDNVVVLMGASTGGYTYIYDQAFNNQTLTLGAHFTLEQSIGNAYFSAGNIGDEVLNAGTMSLAGGDLYDNVSEFVNTGTIILGAGEVFGVQSGGESFANSGTVTIGANAELITAGSFVNTGSITIAQLGSLSLGGTLGLSAVNGITNSGSLSIAGTLELGGGTYHVTSGGSLGVFSITGDIVNGTIDQTNGSLSFGYASTLDGITVLGPFDPEQAVYVRDGLTAETTSGGLPGTIDLRTPGDDLTFQDSETLDHAVVLMGPNTGNSYLYNQQVADQTLTLGSNLTVLQDVGNAQFIGNGALNDALINDGTLNLANGGLLDYEYNFVNNGSITLSAGEVFTVEYGNASFANAGSISIGAASVLVDNGTFANTGAIAIAAGGTLTLAGTTALASITGITNNGLIDIAGTLLTGGGELNVAQNGTFADVLIAGDVVGGTIAPNGGTLTFNNGATLDGVTVLGNFVPATGIYIRDGLSVKTSGGGTPGTIDLRVNGNNLIFQDSETLNNVVILGAVAGVTSYIYTNQVAGQTLTLGPNVQFLQTGGTEQFYGPSTDEAVVNQGTMLLSGGNFQDYDLSFANLGTINLGIGEDFQVQSTAYTFANSGTINVGSGAILNLSTTFVNTGAITVQAGGVLGLGGTIALASLTGITNHGEIEIIGGGTLDLGAGVLNVAQGGTFANLLIAGGGDVVNGTIAPNGGTLTFGSSSTLDGITLIGSVALAGAYVYIRDGLDVTAAGGGEGTLDMSTNSSQLIFEDSETLDNLVILAATNNNNSYLVNDQGAEILTLGAHATLLQTGGTEQLYAPSADEELINQGTMILSGGVLQDYESTFINTGTIALTADENFAMEGNYTFTNDGLIEALTNSGLVVFNTSSGTYTTLLNGNTLAAGDPLLIEDGSTLDMNIGGTITDIAGMVTLFGPSSTLEFYNSGASEYETIESTLGSIASTGTLALLGDRSWTGANALADAGLLQLGGGVFYAPSLAVAGSGHVLGFGTIDNPISNAGLIEAQGGDLVLDFAPTGAGSLKIDAAATLEVGGATAENAAYNGAGATLRLDTPAGYTGTLSGIVASDTLDLQVETATNATSAGDTLTVTLSGGGSLTFALAAPLIGIREGVTLDGQGDTDVIFYRYAAPSLATPASTNFGEHHIGDTPTQAITIANTAATDGYSEKLDASFGAPTGSITATGTVALLAPGGTIANGLTIGLVTSHDGVVSGSAVLTPQTDGTSVDAQPPLNLPGQTISGTGTVFNYATIGVSPTSPISFGQAHVNATVTKTLTITNLAVADGYSENLDAHFSGATGGISTAGTIGELGAGGASTALSLQLTSANAGVISGTSTLAVISDGSTIDTLGTTALSSVVITGSGTIFNLATASAISPNPFNFGEHHVGATLIQAETLANNAATGIYSENLDAVFGPTTGSLTGSGSISELPAGSSSSALSVTLASGSAGLITGAATVDLTSDGSTIDTLGTTALTAQVINATGTIYNLATAAAVTPNPVIFGEAHVGATLTHGVTLDNTAASGIYSENLDAIFTHSGGSLTGSGSVSELLAGSTSSALSVALNSLTAGVITGTATLGLTSDGTGIDTLGNTGLVAQTISATGTIFNLATASAVAPNPINFGILHIGGTLDQGLTISNTAPIGAYSEALDVGFTGSTTNVATGGTIDLLNPGSLSTNVLSVALSSATAGTISGSATLGLTSDGSLVDTLGTTLIGTQTIALLGTFNNYATIAIDELAGGGTISSNGTTTTINLGTLGVSGFTTIDLGIGNIAVGPADSLFGSLGGTAATGFTDSLSSSFGLVAAGSISNVGSIVLSRGSIGLYSETLTIQSTGTNASGYAGALGTETLVIEADVVACFAEGTQIATPAGEVAVEALRAGEWVQTASGRSAEVLWVGRRRLNPRSHTDPTRAQPVCVAAGAFGEALPAQTLRLSPEHAVFVRDVFIPVRHLVNGTSIVAEEVAEVTYYHVALATHDVLLANGLPSESWLDTGVHRGFENPPRPAIRAMLPRHPAAPIVESGRLIDQVRGELATRAIELGYRPRRTYDLVLAQAGVLTGIIPAGTHQVRLRSLAQPLGVDRRRLGAAIRGISLGGLTVALDDPRLRHGFHPIDRQGDAAWRWTEADAVITVDAEKALRFEIHVVAVSQPLAASGSFDIDLATTGVVRRLIPAGTQTVRLHSATAQRGRDLRALGAAIGGLCLDGQAIALDDARLLRGFHQVERDGGQTWRWTEAEAVINVATVADIWLEFDVCALSVTERVAAA